jgi:hypothetical protein
MIDVDVRQIGRSNRRRRDTRHGIDDGAQIKIRGDVVGEVPDNDDEDGQTMDTTGAESMSLS